MDKDRGIVQLPILREHDFHSHVPILGPVIQWIRRILYGLTAKWPVYVIRVQQEQINQRIARELTESRTREAALQQRVSDMEQHWQVAEQRWQETEQHWRSAELLLREFEDRLVDQDRDWAYVTRLVAELDLRFRYARSSTQAGSGEPH